MPLIILASHLVHQLKYNNNTDKALNVIEKTLYGGLTGLIIGTSGQIAQKTLPKTEVIGSIKDTTIKGDIFNKTHKVTVESGASIIGTSSQTIIGDE